MTLTVCLITMALRQCRLRRVNHCSAHENECWLEESVQILQRIALEGCQIGRKTRLELANVTLKPASERGAVRRAVDNISVGITCICQDQEPVGVSLEVAQACSDRGFSRHVILPLSANTPIPASVPTTILTPISRCATRFEMTCSLASHGQK